MLYRAGEEAQARPSLVRHDVIQEPMAETRGGGRNEREEGREGGEGVEALGAMPGCVLGTEGKTPFAGEGRAAGVDPFVAPSQEEKGQVREVEGRRRAVVDPDSGLNPDRASASIDLE